MLLIPLKRGKNQFKKLKLIMKGGRGQGWRLNWAEINLQSVLLSLLPKAKCFDKYGDWEGRGQICN